MTEQKERAVVPAACGCFTTWGYRSLPATDARRLPKPFFPDGADRMQSLWRRAVRSVMHKHLEKMGEVTFDKIFNQKLGYLLFKDFCDNVCDEQVPQLSFYEEIKRYEKLETAEERRTAAREIYDNYIMKELLSHTHNYSLESVGHVQKFLMRNEVPVNLFQPYIEEIFSLLRDDIFRKFIERYAMKCLDKKRIKMKVGETLALNERIMLSLVSTGEDCPFIVCMTYAFQTPDKLCFILDLMNGGDLHYHLSQHGVFTEQEMRFYAAEVVLGLEHMHRRYVVYRDLKPANILLDEHGHVRISDLGLACDFSKKKPHASGHPRLHGTRSALQRHGLRLQCRLVLAGLHALQAAQRAQPVPATQNERQARDRPNDLDHECGAPRKLFIRVETASRGIATTGRGQATRLQGPGGGGGQGSRLLRGLDWQLVYLQRYPPPLIPPRGEVNAADAFDIGSFDEEDTKGIKLTEADQELYKNFPVVISERWQQEIAETVFETVNLEADKLEQKKKTKMKMKFQDEKGGETAWATVIALVGLHHPRYIKKLGGPFASAFQTRYGKLYPNRLELHTESSSAKPELIFMDQMEDVCSDYVQVKGEQCIVLKMKGDTKVVLTNPDEIGLKEWLLSLRSTLKDSQELLASMAKKAGKIYGTTDNRNNLLASAPGTAAATAATSNPPPPTRNGN
ncbi:hypothetical protein HPB48_020515 [Haemaphysalis longicornis]|uniref:G protein-coupled receptor kinase n=1 Tax=Haemaphysalis longicornis TaxID=44386 RepID=A0A9J6GSK8_HAELO|nr:hypothetical protein HPB48_020515 [Haemaphysalis longicornis]